LNLWRAGGKSGHGNAAKGCSSASGPGISEIPETLQEMEIMPVAYNKKGEPGLTGGGGITSTSREFKVVTSPQKLTGGGGKQN